jgi:uncharacterized membrane protein
MLGASALSQIICAVNHSLRKSFPAMGLLLANLIMQLLQMLDASLFFFFGLGSCQSGFERFTTGQKEKERRE